MKIKLVACLFVALIGFVTPTLALDRFFTPPPASPALDARDWFNRRAEPLNEVERAELDRIKSLPPERAFNHLGWIMFNRRHPEAQKLIRQLILEIPNWPTFLVKELDALAKVKTPRELFGPDYDTYISRMGPGRAPLPAAFKNMDYDAMCHLIGKTDRTALDAYLSQQQIFSVLSVLDRPEAALLIIPFLFDRRPDLVHSFDSGTISPEAMARIALGRMNLPGKPFKKLPNHTYEELVELPVWQEWWLRMAPVFGAESPGTITATREEVAALNAKAKVDPAKVEAAAVAFAKAPSLPIDTLPANPPPDDLRWVIWSLGLVLATIVAVMVVRSKKSNA